MRKKGTYNPTQGLIVSPRRNHTPEIKLHSNRPTVNNKEDYFPYGQGYGNPKRDDLGNVPRKMATLNANKVTEFMPAWVFSVFSLTSTITISK